tara:strand:- start:88 stop:237 length:150 start_codon:yes stop_codon:yes gene_type:complete
MSLAWQRLSILKQKLLGSRSEQNEIAFSLRIGGKKPFYEAETLNFLDKD